ncbi:hypothetical protein SPV_2529 [Streptococcus pneumoniae]|nr:hypothetical protein SPV_2529 [Streptococcus pneumoniae]
MEEKIKIKPHFCLTIIPFTCRMK